MNGTLEGLVVSFDPLGLEQSHYIEVVEGAIFMEQNMRFELILDWLVICTGKKVFGRLLATFEGSFLCFRGQKIYIFF